MKNILKIGAISLALIAAIFMLNKAPDVHAATGDTRVQIYAKTGTCMYGTSVFVGATGFSYANQSVTSVFTASNGALPRYCEDTEGDSGRSFTMYMQTDLINLTNNTIKIPSGNVQVSSTQATVVSGTCTTGAYAWTNAPLSGTLTLFQKTAASGQVCTISITGVTLKVVLSGGQQPGIYSGVLVVGRTSTFGDGIMN